MLVVISAMPGQFQSLRHRPLPWSSRRRFEGELSRALSGRGPFPSYRDDLAPDLPPIRHHVVLPHQDNIYLPSLSYRLSSSATLLLRCGIKRVPLRWLSLKALAHRSARGTDRWPRPQV